MATFAGMDICCFTYRSTGNDNSNNNKHICIEPQDRNFRGAGARQRAAETREERKPGRRGMSLAVKYSGEKLHFGDSEEMPGFHVGFGYNTSAHWSE